MYSRLGGIQPTADGFETLRIAPRISRLYGPATVSTKLLTLRGVVWSNWTRHLASSSSSSSHSPSRSRLATVSVEVPLLTVKSTVVLPLLGHAARQVHVAVISSTGFAPATIVWAGEPVDEAFSVHASPYIGDVQGRGERLHVELPLPGRYSFAIEAEPAVVGGDGRTAVNKDI